MPMMPMMPIKPSAALRLATRGAAMAAVLSAAVPAHLLARAGGRRDLVPPAFLGTLGRLCGLRVQVEGAVAQGPVLLVGNHVSWLDVLALGGAAQAAFAAQGGLAGHRLMRWLCRQNDTVFLTRDRRTSVAEQVAQLRSALARRPRLVLFPEGTTGPGHGLLPFKSALLEVAAAGKVAVQPVALVYADAPAIAWGNEPGLANAGRLLGRAERICLTIRYLDPLAGSALASRKAMAQAAQEAIGRALTR